MASWSSFYPDVLPHVPGCPDPLVDQELRRSAIEFFRRTLAWRAWLEAITVLADTRSYEITLPTDAEIIRIERATADGTPIDVVSYTDLELDVSDLEVDPPGVTSQDRKLIWLTRALDADVSVKVQATLRPSETSSTIPDELFDQHANAIAQGARARLMLIPGTAFYQPDLAALAAGLFEREIGSASVAAYMGNTAIMPRQRMKWC